MFSKKYIHGKESHRGNNLEIKFNLFYELCTYMLLNILLQKLKYSNRSFTLLCFVS